MGGRRGWELGGVIRGSSSRSVESVKTRSVGVTMGGEAMAALSGVDGVAWLWELDKNNERASRLALAMEARVEKGWAGVVAASE